MAVNKNLTAGPQPVKYFMNYWSRLTWKRVEAKREYWEVWHRGRHVADFFEGKGGAHWFGCLFGRFTIWRRDKEAVLLTLTAVILGPQN